MTITTRGRTIAVKLSVFGLGYVGCVSAACFAEEGNEVIGVDVNPTKVEIINDGKTPIIEEGINELIAKVVKTGRLSATTDSTRAVNESDLSLVCVGTPSNQSGSLHLRHVEQVCREIGAAIKNKQQRHIVVIRSTMLPGTVQNIVVPALEETSGRKAMEDFGICINPEFLRSEERRVGKECRAGCAPSH